MHNFAHKECLEILGLHPYPSDANLGEMIGATVVARIVAEWPHVRGPQELGNRVYERLQTEIPVPTRQLRYMVLHTTSHTRPWRRHRAGDLDPRRCHHRE